MSATELKIYKCDFFTPTFVSGLKALRECNQLTDVTLKVQGREFSCHKLVLAANSKYFSSIFTADFNEKKSEEIRMPGEIDAEAIETLLNYFYSGELALSQNNVESVFYATDYMRLDPLLEICIENMQKTLDPSNCIRRYAMADPIQYFSPRLDSFRKAASALIVEEISKGPDRAEFLSLSAKLVSKIVQSNSQPERAEYLYAVILKWVRHDEENRRQVLCDLLETLAVDGISDEFFASKIRNEEVLRRDPKCLLWLVDNFTLRQPVLPATRGSLFIMNQSSIRTCFQLKVQNPTLLEVCARSEVSQFSPVNRGKRIYLLCGNKTENAYQLDGPQELWKSSDLDLRFYRYSAGCVILGDELFVLGGTDWKSNSPLSSCIKFSFNSGKKVNLPAMSEARTQPGAVVYANAMYAACGDLASIKSSIERYDSREGQWRTVGRYTTRIGFCSSATVDHYLYSCDVYSGIIERFDFRANQAQQICCLPSTGFKWIASMEGRLFCAATGSVLEYDSTADKWKNFYSGIDLSCPVLPCPVIVPWV